MLLPERLGGLLSPTEAAGIWDDIWQSRSARLHHLEGTRWCSREVQVLLTTGRAVGAKELKDYLEVTGYADSGKRVYTQARSAHDWHSTDLVTITGDPPRPHRE